MMPVAPHYYYCYCLKRQVVVVEELTSAGSGQELQRVGEWRVLAVKGSIVSLRQRREMQGLGECKKGKGVGEKGRRGLKMGNSS
jgi:hypothetical protein